MRHVALPRCRKVLYVRCGIKQQPSIQKVAHGELCHGFVMRLPAMVALAMPTRFKMCALGSLVHDKNNGAHKRFRFGYHSHSTSAIISPTPSVTSART